MTFMEAKLDPMFPEGSAEHLVRFDGPLMRCRV